MAWLYQDSSPRRPGWLKRWLSPAAPPHYYGDIVRKLFMLAGILMLVGLPFFYPYLPVPILVSLLIALGAAVVAGLTNPRQRWILLLDVLASIPGVIIFEYHAIIHYSEIPVELFIMDQVLTLIFFFALYFSVKSFRGAILDSATRQRPKA